MYKIPSNVTGYVRFPEIDLPEFKILCYSLQGLGLLKVIEVPEYRYPNNIYKAKVKDKENEFYIYMNYSVLVFGFSQVSEIYKISESFINKSFLKEAIEGLDNRYSVIDANILNSEATKQNFVLLDGYEYKQVIYWYPNTIGEVIFSQCFD